MRYKVIYGGNTCTIPNQLVGKYQRTFSIKQNSTTKIPTVDGDMLYLHRTTTADGVPELYIDLKSGRACSAFYNYPTSHCQTGFHWMCFNDLYQEDGATLRVYTFGDLYGDTMYDIHGASVQHEVYCSQFGECIATLIFHTSDTGDYFELVGAYEASSAHAHQEFYIPDTSYTVNGGDTLHVFNSIHMNTVDTGVCYYLDSGEASFGIYVRHERAECCSNYGYFSSECITPTDGDQILIYVGLDYYDLNLPSTADDQGCEYAWRRCNETGIIPITLSYYNGIWHKAGRDVIHIPHIAENETIFVDDHSSFTQNDVRIALSLKSGLESTSFYYRKSENRCIMHSYVNEFTDLFPAPQIGDEIRIFRYADGESSYDVYYAAGSTLALSVGQSLARNDDFHNRFAKWLEANYGTPIVLQYTGSWRLKK